jgi:hypothetical protein
MFGEQRWWIQRTQVHDSMKNSKRPIKRFVMPVVIYSLDYSTDISTRQTEWPITKTGYFDAYDATGRYDPRLLVTDIDYIG